jgi:hypothetical protein
MPKEPNGGDEGVAHLVSLGPQDACIVWRNEGREIEAYFPQYPDDEDVPIESSLMAAAVTAALFGDEPDALEKRQQLFEWFIEQLDRAPDQEGDET